MKKHELGLTRNQIKKKVILERGREWESERASEREERERVSEREERELENFIFTFQLQKCILFCKAKKMSLFLVIKCSDENF